MEQIKTYKTSDPCIKVDHPIAMVDAEVEITVSGLNPYQKITIVGYIEERNAKCISYAHFIANNSGCVNLKTHPSVDGTYTGVDSMGIVWSMVYLTQFRFIQRNANYPYDIELSVMDGFHTV